MRVDFNVPMDDKGEIIDDARIVAAIPTIEHVMQQGGRLILMSHLGRPQGKPNPQYSLKGVAAHLERLLNKPVLMADDCVGPEVQNMSEQLSPGEVMLLENVRFHPEEEKNDSAFARELAMAGDIYVNDAFGTAHRAHASTAGIAEYLPAYAGFLLETEVNMLSQVLNHPQAPRMAILGGAKVKDKLKLIRNLLDKLDVLLVAGGMGNTFLAARGFKVGQSLYEEDMLAECRQLLEFADSKGKVILMPADVVVSYQLAPDERVQVVDIDVIPEDMMIVDIGPKTVKGFAMAISKAQTIIWNGPLGVYEYPEFALGTEAIAHAVVASNAVSVVGGGDSAAVIHKLGLEKEITHISTGGGATLEFLEGLELPGVKSCQ